MKLETLKRDKILPGKILDGEHYVFLSRCLSSLPVDIYLDTHSIITDGIYGIWFRIAHPASKKMMFSYYSFVDTKGVFHGRRDLIILSDAELKEISGFAVRMWKAITALSKRKLTLRTFLLRIIKDNMSYSPFSPMKRIKPPVCRYRYWIEVSTGLEVLFSREKECHKVPAVLAKEILGLEDEPVIEDDGFHYKITRDYTRPSIIFAFDDISIVEKINRYLDKKYATQFQREEHESEKEYAIHVIESVYLLDEDATINEMFPSWRRMITAARNTLALAPDKDARENKLYIEYADILLETLPNAVAHPLYL